MTSTTCIVHSHKNVSKFHTATKQLRLENWFPADVYQQLPNKCCSCNGKRGLKTIDLEVLRKICDDIMLSTASTLKFRFSSNMSELVSMEASEDNSDELDEKIPQKSNSTTNTEYTRSPVPRLGSVNFRPIFVGGYPRLPMHYGHRNPASMFRSRPTFYNPYHSTTLDLDTEDQHKSSKKGIIKQDFSKVLENFKVTTANDGCIVHNSKYQSKFNCAVNLLRRTKEFQQQTYHEMPKKCCSCNGKTGMNIIDLNVLSGVCDEIESERVNKPVLKKHFYLLTLSFEPNISRHVRRARTGRFIGKGGENVRAMQDKHNVCLQLIDRSSNEKRCQRLDELKKIDEKEDNKNTDDLYLLVTSKTKSITNTIPIEEIEQEITQKWKEINTNYAPASKSSFNRTKPRKQGPASIASIEPIADNRWNTKQHRHRH
ncbi:unnamed protein product [Rotaria magnacalcarata]|uniref:K Homology domain-containing protein n=1 Tax=Rotaria magnacalcarata TaxID=392030 RepID=A0A815BS06_9BILA|nr:unnamed protein product [Rotaria magnacalcarata]CAF1511436.1 unnamed protein product [Rotaria magnacalcarata]CAF2004693.1 unnamed protein product [Rotaria magnacalcarata]CAF4063316.1 unnamed protein product [Rotaria magnacalcarata]